MISELKFNPESLMRFRKKAKTPGGKTVVGWLTRHELDFILNDAEQERIRKGDFYIYSVEEYEGKYYRILPETVEDIDDEHEQNDLNILHREINFAIHILEQARQKIEYMKNFRPGIESLKQEEK
ncbi:MAG: hypothetical protein IJU70_11920 [Lentisphaeria bacterium]|nr:hypothetical protein [Lentisphaeria bacterium]